VTSVYQPLKNQLWSSVRQAGSQQLRATTIWALEQPATQWTAKEFYKAGNREIKARDALSHWFGSTWGQSLMACHTQLDAIATALPEAWPITRQAKLVTRHWAKQFKRGALALQNQNIMRKVIGSVTFKGLFDTVFYAWGIKGALIAAHFVPGSPLHVVSPLIALYTLRAGALVGPYYTKTKQQLNTLSHPALKRVQAKLMVLTQSVKKPVTGNA
jgi:hypothetical protein